MSLFPKAESDGRERVKNFELVIQGLRERIASMKNVERDMAHEMAEIEAKAESAVKTKLELRSKVLGIKSDFEVRKEGRIGEPIRSL